MKKFFYIIFICLFFTEFAKAECFDDWLKENIKQGEILITFSGLTFDTGIDRLNAALWFPLEDLKICGPQVFNLEGKTFQYYDIINLDDNENKVFARLMN